MAWSHEAKGNLVVGVEIVAMAFAAYLVFGTALNLTEDYTVASASAMATLVAGFFAAGALNQRSQTLRRFLYEPGTDPNT